MCDASYVTWYYRQYRRYVNFARKYKILQNVNILGSRFNSSGTPLFWLKNILSLWSWGLNDASTLWRQYHVTYWNNENKVIGQQFRSMNCWPINKRVLQRMIFLLTVKMVCIYCIDLKEPTAYEIVERTLTFFFTYLITLCKDITFPLIKKLYQTGHGVIYP